MSTAPAGRNLGVVSISNGRGKARLLSEADPQTGVAVVHAKRIDFLDDWLDTDRITPDQWQAARDFQANFHKAGRGERYKSIFDITTAGGSGNATSYDGLSKGADAAHYVNRALACLGPAQQSVVINVIGLENSLRQCVGIWRTNGKVTNVDRLTGLLHAALETMAMTMLTGERRAKR